MSGWGGAQTWRMVRLTGRAATTPCNHCGAVHEYLVRPKHGGDCQPVLLPPGFVSTGLSGVEVAVFSVSPDELDGFGQEETAYARLARQVAARGIRCERCGARFEDLDRYAAHTC